MIYLALLVVLAACGGGSGHDSGGVSKTPQADWLIGGGLTQGWYLHPREMVDAVADAGLTLTEIEWVSDQQSIACPHGAVRASDWFGTDMRAAEEVVDQARKRNITVFINIANANNCAVMSQPDGWFLDRLEEVLVIGYDHVLIQGVSEPWAAPERSARWIEFARRKVDPAHFVGPGGAFMDTHYCDFGKLITALKTGRQHEISNTDCRPILDPGPGPAAELARAAKLTRSPLLIYDFYSRDLSTLPLTLKAMGDAIK